MGSNLSSPRAHSLRPVLLVVLALAVVGTAGRLILWNRVDVAPVQAPPAQVAAQPALAPAPAQKPTFDIVRVNPKGDAVMAGRAAPGAKVIISDGGKTIGQAQADQNGDWVFVPSTRLAPGARTLTLTERMPNGGEAKGDRSVVLVVPQTSAKEQGAQTPPALAVLTGPNVPPAILTGPSAEANGSHLAVDAAEYGDRGKLAVAGTAAPGATVRVYLDDKLAGQAVTGPDGKWSLSSSGAVTPGGHRVRVDQIGANGAVASRVEQSFTRAQMELAAGNITIAPGQNLWTIARRAYGQGTRYLVIFQANRHAIRDPNLIYPGQVFALPASGPAPATPASSSKSR